MSGSHATWQCVSSQRQGSTVAALATAAGVLFAATPAGIRRSADRGQNWTVAGTSTSVPFADSIAALPVSEANTLLAGAADGLYRSSDGGESWQRLLVGRVLAIAVAPGALCLAGTESDGVLRSEDAGRTWTGANAGLLDLTVTALAVSPSFDRDRTAFAGTASGLYRTRNGARAWRAAETDVAEPAVQCLAVSPNFGEDRLVLAGTEVDGLLRSDDGGSTWHMASALPGRSVTALSFGPNGTVAAASEAGVAVSCDRGQTWRMTHLEAGPVLSLLFLDATLLAGLAGDGLASSSDGGETWTRSAAGLNASLLLGLALSPSFADDQTLYVAGPQAGISISTDAGHTWRPWAVGLEDATVLGLAVTNSGNVLAATSDGLFRAGGAQPEWQRCVEEPVRAVAASRHTPVLLSATANRLLLSADGASWRPLETSFNADVVSLAVSAGGTLYAGTARPDGEIVLWRSPDAGATWQRWLLERASGGVLPIALPPARVSNETIYVGINHRVLHPIRHAREVRAGERRPLWRPTPLGDASQPVTALAAPDPGTVLAATSGAVYLSQDGAESFHVWNDGLPSLPVVALAAAGDVVYALALGGTLWRATVGAGAAGASAA